MNLYFVLEGFQTEKKVYRSWLSHVLPNFTEVSRVDDLDYEDYILVIGHGYPSYLRRIEAAIQDISNHRESICLIICIDAEEMQYDQKYSEIESIVHGKLEQDRYFIIIHDCCIETWFLANTKVMKRNPSSSELISMKNFYDVSCSDPELMPLHHDYSTRAQFQYEYLKCMLGERGVHYSKKKPGVTTDLSYLQALVERHEKTNHLKSFCQFIRTFKGLGSRLFIELDID